METAPAFEHAVFFSPISSLALLAIVFASVFNFAPLSSLSLALPPTVFDRAAFPAPLPSLSLALPAPFSGLDFWASLLFCPSRLPGLSV